MLKKFSTYTFALLAMIVLFSSCEKEYEGIESIDDAKINAYFTANNITGFKKDPAGFYYKITDQGTGSLLTNQDSVLYNYDIKNFTGTTYSSTAANTNEGTYVGYVNPSSYRGVLTKIGRGGKFTIILPSYLAFGKNGSGSIPSNEIILSDVLTYPEASQAALDETRIRAYLTSNNLLSTAVRDPSGVYYIINTPGTGTQVNNVGSTVTVNYTGRLLDGTVFDSSTDGTFVTPLLSLPGSGVIKGWGKVIPKLKVGGKMRMFIPSDLAYGRSANGTIPANSILDFDVEVTAVTN